MKVVFATLLLVSLLLSSSFLEITTADPTTPDASMNAVCGTKCDNRCSKAGRPKECMKDCQICCKACNACVPSGTYGNKSECPCYANKLNSKGGPKCP